MPGVVARSGNAQMVPQAQPGLLCQHRTREDPTRFLPGFTPCFFPGIHSEEHGWGRRDNKHL